MSSSSAIVAGAVVADVIVVVAVAVALATPQVRSSMYCSCVPGQLVLKLVAGSFSRACWKQRRCRFSLL